ncbi:PREDICTED: ciliogenesis-associated TTC17-interacting protein-like [Priapulus caudatus]|uniref:Ciliogenesis-associated TTC17-interacting protein-like n=1 Tax=Priapulus caudatus TaxID=37621 RepID=A0ABM1DQA3_PRICU|nr:PREDICTED: ciliogenesis-associated TTC17-interacting protein-like [Priapulus caudatus]
MKLIGIPPYSQLEGALGVTKKPLEWESDLQMKSNFLDKKEQLKADHGVYMRRHPELKAILADFLQFLLLRKPRDVFAFAADYYASFCHKYPDNPLRAPPK